MLQARPGLVTLIPEIADNPTRKAPKAYRSVVSIGVLFAASHGRAPFGRVYKLTAPKTSPGVTRLYFGRPIHCARGFTHHPPSRVDQVGSDVVGIGITDSGNR